MQLALNYALAQGYSSGCQIARRLSEGWALENVACSEERLTQTPSNTHAVDFICEQLKARRGWSERKIPDAGYGAMIRAIRGGQTPNLLLLQYTSSWTVRNLM